MKNFLNWSMVLCVFVVLIVFIYNPTLFSSFALGWCSAIFAVGLIEVIKDYKKKRKNKKKD